MALGLTKMSALFVLLFASVLAVSAASTLIFAYHTYSVNVEDLRLAKVDGYTVMGAFVNTHSQASDSKIRFVYYLDGSVAHDFTGNYRSDYRDWIDGIVYPSPGSHTLKVDVFQYDPQDTLRYSTSVQKTVYWDGSKTTSTITPTGTSTVTVPPTPTSPATSPTPPPAATVRIESVWIDPSEPRQGETFRVKVRFNVDADPRVRLNLYLDGSWKDVKEETFSRGTHEREFVRGDSFSSGSHEARVEAFIDGTNRDSRSVSFNVRSDGTGRSDIDVRVRDNRDSRDISGARVELLRSGTLRDWKHTDSSGRATFFSYEPGCYDVKASHPDFNERTVSRCFSSGERPEVSIWLDRRDSGSATIRVTVRDSSTSSGLADARVEISGARSQSSATPSSGEVRFESLPSGSYTVRVSRTDYNSAEQSISLNTGEFRDVAFTLSRTTATTTTSNQNPIAELVITPSTSVTDTQTVTLDGSRSRDNDGRIVNYEFLDNSSTLQSSPSPTLSRTFSAGTHSFSLRVTDDRNAQTTSSTQTLTVSASAATTSTRTLLVVVRDKDSNERLSDARVFVDGQSGTTSSDGTRSFSVSPKCYDVEASKSGYRTEVVNRCVSSGADETVTVYIKSTGAVATTSTTEAASAASASVTTFAGHDLTISSVSHPFEIVAGQQFTVTVRVRNAGEFYESGINLDGTIGSNSARIGTFALGSGSETTQTLTLTAPSTAGSYSLTIKVWNPYDQQTITNEVRVVGSVSFAGASGVSGVAKLRTDVRFDTTSVNVEQFRSDVINVRVTNFLTRAETFKVSSDLPSSVAYTPAPEIIQPGETKVLTIYVAPKEIGTYRGTVRVAAGEELIAEQPVTVFAGDFKAREPDAPGARADGKANFFEQVALPVYVGLGAIALVLLVIFAFPILQQMPFQPKARAALPRAEATSQLTEGKDYYIVPKDRIVE